MKKYGLKKQNKRGGVGVARGSEGYPIRGLFVRHPIGKLIVNFDHPRPSRTTLISPLFRNLPTLYLGFRFVFPFILVYPYPTCFYRLIVSLKGLFYSHFFLT